MEHRTIAAASLAAGVLFSLCMMAETPFASAESVISVESGQSSAQSDAESVAEAADAAVIYDQAQDDEMEYKLVRLTENDQGGLTGTLHCRNLTDHAVSRSFTDIGVNNVLLDWGHGFSGMSFNLAPGEECDADFSTEDFYRYISPDDPSKQKVMLLKDPPGYFGVTEIDTLSFFYSGGVFEQEKDPVCIRLSEPLPYTSHADQSEETDSVKLYEDDRICAELDRVGIFSDFFTLAMILENKTAQSQTFYLSGMLVNSTAPFKNDRIDGACFTLKPGMKEHYYLYFEQDDESYEKALYHREESTEPQKMLETIRFAILLEDAESQNPEVHDVTLKLPEPVDFILGNAAAADSSGTDIEAVADSPAANPEVTEIAANRFEAACEDESDQSAPLFAEKIGLPEDAAEQRLLIPLSFGQPWTDEMYNELESAVAVIQLRATDPEWQEDAEGGMYVRPIAQIQMHPDGEGGFYGVYSGLVLTAGDDGRFVIPVEEDGLGEEQVAAQPLSGIILNTDRRFNELSDRQTGLYGRVKFDAAIDYGTGNAMLTDLSIITANYKTNEDSELAAWPISRFDNLYNGAVRCYKKWMLIEQGLYEEKTSFRAHSGDLDPYIINNETVPLKFVPFSEVMDPNDETTVSYVLKFKDGSVYRTNPS